MCIYIYYRYHICICYPPPETHILYDFTTKNTVSCCFCSTGETSPHRPRFCMTPPAGKVLVQVLFLLLPLQSVLASVLVVRIVISISLGSGACQLARLFTKPEGTAMWNDPPFSTLTEGQQICLVIQVFQQSSGTCEGQTLGRKDPFCLDAPLEVGIWTVYDVTFAGFRGGVGFLQGGSSTVCYRETLFRPEVLKTIRELCSGMGGISIGASFLGYSTAAFNDKSELACQAIRLNGGTTIQGDIACTQVVKAMHGSGCPSTGVATAGFPCQPYSLQGDKGGLGDARGCTLIHVLRAAWLLQAHCLVLENVSEVAAHADTMQVLADFAQTAGFQQSSTVLELAEHWPARRKRWWQVMLPSDLPTFSLMPWPEPSSRLCIRDVLPE